MHIVILPQNPNVMEGQRAAGVQTETRGFLPAHCQSIIWLFLLSVNQLQVADLIGRLFKRLMTTTENCQADREDAITDGFGVRTGAGVEEEEHLKVWDK